MNKLDQLWVRACKVNSDSIGPRLNSIARRFYNVGEDRCDGLIIDNLTRLCDDYRLLSLRKLICNVDPNGLWQLFADDYDFATNLRESLISAVRVSRPHAFDGLTAPLRQRNRFPA